MKYFIAVLILVSQSIYAQPQSLPDESNPIIASVIVMSQAYAIERLVGYCDKNYPSYTFGNKTAQDKWLASHDNIYKKAGKIIISQMPKEQRKAMFRNFKLTNNEIEKKLDVASAIGKESWCKSASQKIQAPQMSLLNRTTLVRAISNFVVKQ